MSTAFGMKVVDTYFGVLTQQNGPDYFKTVVKIYRLHNDILVYESPGKSISYKVITPQEFEKMTSNELITI